MAEPERRVDVDVVVAGAGAAGTSAALAAAQGGASVVLLEAQETYRRGSNTAMSTSMIPAGGSRWQAAIGIEDSPGRFADDIRTKTKGAADPVVTKALTQVAPELVAWLADIGGLPLELVTDFRYPGHSRDRCHAVPDRAGRTMHGHLLERVAASEAITLVVPMQLEDVEVEDGGVTAIVASPDGARETITTDAVVLATNGFGADSALVERHIPDIAAGTYHGGDGSRGDALRIGRRLGADVGYLDAYQGHGSLATPHEILLTWATVMHGAILVNTEGERFGDETEGYSEFGARVVAQPGATAWMLFDERIDAACRPFADYQDLREAGAVRWAADVDALAKTTGTPVERLAVTLEHARQAAQGLRADDHGRRSFETPLTAPYAAVKVTGALFHTQGGLHVDEHARVLAGGAPVTGLYAAGGAAVGISGHGADGYLAGNGLLSALGLGYLAGRHLTQQQLPA
ncbi:MAG: FAD-binding protein [Nitriliruptoraceae bacterium]